MGKVLIGVIIAIVLIAGIGAVTVLTSPTAAALLYLDSGDVTVNGAPGTNEMKLSKGDVVSTGSGGSAIIAFYEGELLSLDENTKITIQELSKTKVSVKQDSGSSWSEITKLSGIEQYDVETPTTVATVRGTAFAIRIGDDTFLVVGDGTVLYNVGTGQVEVSKGEKVGEDLEILELDAEDESFINKHRNKALTAMKNLRWREINKKRVLLNTVKKMYDLNEKDIREILADIDSGEITKQEQEEALAQAPFKVPSLEKIKNLNKAIKELSDELA